MLILVDGYNVTRQDPATRDLSIEQQRDALTRRIKTRGSALLGRGRIVIVFDARDGIAGGTGESSAGVRVVYACTRSADDEIVALATKAAEKVVVVSDDRELLGRVRVHAPHGVEALPASRCFDSAAGQARAKRRAPIAREGGLPPGANKITQELKDLWLNGEEDE